MNEAEITLRKVNLPGDRQAILEFHCRINYDSDTPFARRVSYEEYREKWLRLSQVESFLSHLIKSMQDDRTLAEVWEAEGNTVSYLWMTFTDLPDYDLTIAELMDIAVHPLYQRQGIGLRMLQRAEEHARKLGATLFRSDTGIENLASQKLHAKAGFKPFRIGYEKVLR